MVNQRSAIFCDSYSSSISKILINKAIRVLKTTLYFSLAHWGGVPFLQSFMLGRTCQVNLGFPENKCSNLGKYPEIQKQVQTESSQIFLYYNLVIQIPAIIYIFIVGKSLVLIYLFVYAVVYK